MIIIHKGYVLRGTYEQIQLALKAWDEAKHPRDWRGRWTNSAQYGPPGNATGGYRPPPPSGPRGYREIQNSLSRSMTPFYVSPTEAALQRTPLGARYTSGGIGGAGLDVGDVAGGDAGVGGAGSRLRPHSVIWELGVHNRSLGVTQRQQRFRELADYMRRLAQYELQAPGTTTRITELLDEERPEIPTWLAQLGVVQEESQDRFPGYQREYLRFRENIEAIKRVMQVGRGALNSTNWRRVIEDALDYTHRNSGMDRWRGRP